MTEGLRGLYTASSELIHAGSWIWVSEKTSSRQLVNRGNLPHSGSRPAIFGTTRTVTVVLRENVSGDPPAPMRDRFPESMTRSSRVIFSEAALVSWLILERFPSGKNKRSRYSSNGSASAA